MSSGGGGEPVPAPGPQKSSTRGDGDNIPGTNAKERKAPVATGDGSDAASEADETAQSEIQDFRDETRDAADVDESAGEDPAETGDEDVPAMSMNEMLAHRGGEEPARTGDAGDAGDADSPDGSVAAGTGGEMAEQSLGRVADVDDELADLVGDQDVGYGDVQADVDDTGAAVEEPSVENLSQSERIAREINQRGEVAAEGQFHDDYALEPGDATDTGPGADPGDSDGFNSDSVSHGADNSALIRPGSYTDKTTAQESGATAQDALENHQPGRALKLAAADAATAGQYETDIDVDQLRERLEAIGEPVPDSSVWEGLAGAEEKIQELRRTTSVVDASMDPVPDRIESWGDMREFDADFATSVEERLAERADVDSALVDDDLFESAMDDLNIHLTREALEAGGQEALERTLADNLEQHMTDMKARELADMDRGQGWREATADNVGVDPEAWERPESVDWWQATEAGGGDPRRTVAAASTRKASSDESYDDYLSTNDPSSPAYLADPDDFQAEPKGVETRPHEGARDLSDVPDIGNRAANKIAREVGVETERDLVNVSREDLESVNGVGKGKIETLMESREAAESLDREINEQLDYLEDRYSQSEWGRDEFRQVIEHNLQHGISPEESVHGNDRISDDILTPLDSREAHGKVPGQPQPVSQLDSDLPAQANKVSLEVERAMNIDQKAESDGWFQKVVVKDQFGDRTVLNISKDHITFPEKREFDTNESYKGPDDSAMDTRGFDPDKPLGPGSKLTVVGVEGSGFTYDRLGADAESLVGHPNSRFEIAERTDPALNQVGEEPRPDYSDSSLRAEVSTDGDKWSIAERWRESRVERGVSDEADSKSPDTVSVTTADPAEADGAGPESAGNISVSSMTISQDPTAAEGKTVTDNSSEDDFDPKVGTGYYDDKDGDGGGGYVKNGRSYSHRYSGGCPDCGHEWTHREGRQMRSADEGQTVKYECGDCGNNWMENS